MEPSQEDKSEMQRMRPNTVNDAKAIGDVARAQGQKPEVNLTNTIVSPNGVLSEAQAGVRPLEHSESEVTEPIGTALVEAAKDALPEAEEVIELEAPKAEKVGEDVERDAQVLLANISLGIKLASKSFETFETTELKTAIGKLEESLAAVKSHLKTLQKR